MERNACRDSCALLYKHWTDGTRLESLPLALRPADRAEAYRVQACIEDYSGKPLMGWKIAATSIAGQQHIGVDGPLAGRLLAERAIADGGLHVMGSNLMKVAEVEFAFRMAEDLPPRPKPYTQAEVMARVAALHPAIEIPNSRYEHFEQAGAPQLIADNACAHYFVLGAAAAADWRPLDLAAFTVRAFRNDALAETGLGANVLGDPRIALAWLANELSRHGVTLKKDQAVITGTCAKPVAIAPGDRIRGDFGVLGQIEASFG